MYNIDKEKGNIMAEKASKKNSKWLYSFHIEKEKEVLEETVSKDEKGDEITITKNVVKKVPITFKFRRPTRRIIDDADLHYSVKLSEGIKAGLLTRNLIARRYDDDGGLFNENEKEQYLELFNELTEKENNYHELMLKMTNEEESKSKESMKKSQDLLNEITDARRKLLLFEQAQQSVFENTAENRARNSTIMWWVLNISYMENQNGDYDPVFPGGTYEEKLQYYDDLEESFDDFSSEYIKKLAFLISFWYTGKISDEDDFQAAENMYNTEFNGFEDPDEEGNDNVKNEEDETVLLHTARVERETEQIRKEIEAKETQKEVDKMEEELEKEQGKAKKKPKKESKKREVEKVEKKGVSPDEDN